MPIKISRPDKHLKGAPRRNYALNASLLRGWLADERMRAGIDSKINKAVACCDRECASIWIRDLSI
jgi:hypothetical protein